MGCKYSVLHGHTTKLFIKRVGPGEVPVLDLGGKDLSSGAWDLFEVLSIHDLYDANPDWINMKNISWRWVSGFKLIV